MKAQRPTLLARLCHKRQSRSTLVPNSSLLLWGMPANATQYTAQLYCVDVNENGDYANGMVNEAFCNQAARCPGTASRSHLPFLSQTRCISRSHGQSLPEGRDDNPEGGGE